MKMKKRKKHESNQAEIVNLTTDESANPMKKN